MREGDLNVELHFKQRLEARGVSVHDIRTDLPKKADYPRLPLGAFQYTAVHYTAADRPANIHDHLGLEADIQSWIGHANHHINTNGWPGIAYAVGISQSGRVFILRDFNEMGFHAYNANVSSFAVACDCRDSVTFALLVSLDDVLDVLHRDMPALLNLAPERTYGHQELTFLDKRNVTACPGSVLLDAVQGYREAGLQPAPDVIQVGPFGKHIGGGFKSFWEDRVLMGVDIFGWPITEEMQEDGRTVQYFERARFELHGSDVLLGLVGSEAYQARYL